MTDISLPAANKTQSTVNDTQPTPLSATAKSKGKSPLDILEDVLKDAKTAPTAESQADKETPPQEEVDQAAAAEQAQLAAARTQQKQEDERRIQAQLEQMRSITQSEPEKERQEQEAEEAEEKQAETKSHQGYEIRQIEHKKV